MRIHQLAHPLQFIGVGGFLVVVDVNVHLRLGGWQPTVDLLSDVAGYALASVGLFLLARLRVDRRFTLWTAFLSLVAAGGALWIALGPTDVENPANTLLPEPILRTLVLSLLATFCWEMNRVLTLSGCFAQVGTWHAVLILFVAGVFGPELNIVLFNAFASWTDADKSTATLVSVIVVSAAPFLMMLWAAARLAPDRSGERSDDEGQDGKQG